MNDQERRVRRLARIAIICGVLSLLCSVTSFSMTVYRIYQRANHAP